RCQRAAAACAAAGGMRGRRLIRLPLRSTNQASAWAVGSVVDAVAIMMMEHQIDEKQEVTIHSLRTIVPNVSEEISEDFLLDFDDLAVQVGLLLTSIFPAFRLVK
ncbi:hypothetical protein B296_00043304, partial [Ensete ventricosum]